VHEIEKGITLLDHKGATARAAGLRGWLSGLIAGYNDKILGLDADTAAVSGRLEATAIAGGHNPGMADAITAGIAHAHDLIVVTRTIEHFRPFGVAVCAPDEVAGT
jgi:predicted nucleic acid-binding protein